jgi:large subunit ribosomal protein L20
MPRAPRSIPKRARHKKWIKRAKGYRNRRSRIFKLAKEAVLKAGQYAFRDRRKKKAVVRAVWQTHLNAAVRPLGMTYSTFIHALRTKNVALDRKVMAQLAQEEPDVFKKIVEKIQG